MTAARASAILDVPPGCAPAAARAAFLRRLGDEGFVPPEAAAAAANVLAGTPLPLSDGGREFEAGLCREAVDAFAAAFWSLAPADRRARWVDLGAGFRHDRELHAARQRLEPGLDVAYRFHTNPLAEEVAGAIRDQFVLRPRERAVRRADWLAARADRMRDLSDAARRLRADDPALAALDPDLLRRLSFGVPLDRVPERAPPVVWQAAEPSGKWAAAAPKSPPETVGGINWSAISILVVVAGAILRGVASVSHSSAPQIKYSPPDPPAIRFPDLHRPLADDHSAARKYDRYPSGSVPPDYPLYRLMDAGTAPTTPSQKPFVRTIPTLRR